MGLENGYLTKARDIHLLFIQDSSDSILLVGR